MILPLTEQEMMIALCRSTGMYGIYLNIYIPVGCSAREVYDAAPYLERDDLAELVDDGHGVILFHDAQTMERYYDMTVGDDGPTELNCYNGPVRIYALTCGPEGTRNENT